MDNNTWSKACDMFDYNGSVFQWGYFVMMIEWLTFIATHTRGPNWKIPDEEFPWICKKVMANGMLLYCIVRYT